MAKVLFVEDEKALSDVVVDWLTAQQYIVEHVADGQEALHRLNCYQYDVVILDWGLPGISGIEVCQQFRSKGGATPVLMLTGKRDVDDKEAGLDAGADDYLTKPFHMKELAARLRALLRRPQAVVSNQLTARDVVLDPTTHRVTKGGAEVNLLPREFALLEFLMKHPSQVFSADALLDRLWASESDATSGTIRTYVNRLRNKIDTEGQPSLICTVHGIGYRFDP